ncbi:MAG TPA: hypothetical protein VK620_05780, partial [Bradyrhizobium sp.]|nr:hypothetical protein [Bradyrhizobium sp.]
HPALSFVLSMISGQTLRVCPEGKPVSTFPDHAQRIPAIKKGAARRAVPAISGVDRTRAANLSRAWSRCIHPIDVR